MLTLPRHVKEPGSAAVPRSSLIAPDQPTSEEQHHATDNKRANPHGDAMVTTLLIEDNLIFRQAFKEALLTHFPAMQIEEASEGVRALEIIRASRPQLIFIDIKLPGESGLSLARKVKQLCPKAKVVILTAYDATEYLEAAAEAGVTCFALKGSLGMEDVATLLHEIRIN